MKVKVTELKPFYNLDFFIRKWNSQSDDCLDRFFLIDLFKKLEEEKARIAQDPILQRKTIEILANEKLEFLFQDQTYLPRIVTLMDNADLFSLAPLTASNQFSHMINVIQLAEEFL